VRLVRVGAAGGVANLPKKRHRITLGQCRFGVAARHRGKRLCGLGEPDYYGRFGFVARDKLIVENVPAQFFIAQSFTGDYPCGKVSIIAPLSFALD